MKDPVGTGSMKMKSAYDAIKDNLSNKIPSSEMTKASTAIFTELIRQTEGKDVDDETVRSITRNLISNYFRAKYPSIALKEELPNKVASQNNGIRDLTNDVVKNKADLTVAGEKVKMFAPEGYFIYVPVENVQEAERRGARVAK
jgi:hypothetical protein